MRISFALFNSNYQIHTRWLSFAIIVYCFIIYGNSIQNGYSLDDELVTNTDRQIHPLVSKGIKGIPKIFKSNYAQNEEQNYEYRPLVLVSFAIEKSLFGSSDNWVHISHALQILLYGLLGIVLFKTLNLLFKNDKTLLSFGITFLFLSLPIHSEVINNLKNRDEILSLLFSLLALGGALKYMDQQKKKYLILTSLYFVLAIMSKKTALPFLFIIPITLAYFRQFSWKKIGVLFVFLIIGRAVFALFKRGLLEQDKIRNFSIVENPLFNEGFLARIPVFFHSCFWYFKSTIFHFDFHYYYGYGSIKLLEFGDGLFLFSLIVILVIATIVMLGIFNKKYREISFGLLFFLLAIGGACNLIFPMVGIVAERLVFTASFGVVFALTFIFLMIIENKRIPRKIISIGIVIYLIANSWIGISRNPIWKNRVTLFTHDSKNFNSAKCHALLGQELQYLINQEWTNPSNNDAAMYVNIIHAKTAYHKALVIYPEYYKIENNLASIYATYYCDEGRAIQSTNKIILKNPKYEAAYENNLRSHLRAYLVWNKLYPLLVMEKANDQTNSTNKLKYFPSLGILNQIEERGKLLIKNGLNPSSIQMLVSFTKGAQSLNNELLNICPKMPIELESQLNNLYLGKTANYNVLDTFRKQIISNKKLKVSLITYQEIKNELRDECISSAERYASKFSRIHANDQLDPFFIEAMDYDGIIMIHSNCIKQGKGKAKDFIQIGNAYLNLGDKIKAKKALNMGLKAIEASNNSNKKSEALKLQKFIDAID